MLVAEGRIPIVVLVVVAAAVTFKLGFIWALPAWFSTGWLVTIFWIRPLKLPAMPLAILSPVDASVESVSNAVNPCYERSALRCRLRMVWPGVTLVRSPTEGKVMRYWTGYAPGASERGSPTRYGLWIQTDEGDDVMLEIVTAPFSRFKCAVAPGERLGQGSRAGFVFFGRWTEVFMPENTEMQVAEKAEVRAGEAVLASLNRVPRGRG